MAKAIQYSPKVYIWEISKPYRSEVEKVLARMLTTHAGKTILKHINAKAHWMLIQPFKPTKNDPVNAYAQERNTADSAPPGYVVDTVTFNVPFFGGRVEFPRTIGTGRGSRVDIYYHPATWHEVNKRMKHIAPGAGPAEVMFHEMVHGLREQSGLLRYRDTVPGEERYDSIEEFYAIMGANVYRSERGFTKLRADHWGYGALNGGAATQYGYYQQYKIHIDKWFSEQRAFCMDMAQSPAKFNPYREAAVDLKLMAGPSVSMRL